MVLGEHVRSCWVVRLRPTRILAGVRAERRGIIREATGSAVSGTFTIESAGMDAYGVYWLDGAGDKVRLRLPNVRPVLLYEVLGHGIQSASLTARVAAEDVTS